MSDFRLNVYFKRLQKKIPFSPLCIIYGEPCVKFFGFFVALNFNFR